MARCRTRRVRAIRAGGPQGPVRSTITARDHARLENELCARPDLVLDHFEACQVHCLMELPLFLRLLTRDPKQATKVAIVAVSRGIPIGDEETP